MLKEMLNVVNVYVLFPISDNLNCLNFLGGSREL